MSAAAATVGFDDVPLGALPKGWTPGVTRTGEPKWAVAHDPSAPSAPNVLAQTGHGAFPFCVDPSVSLADGYVEVKFKPISGREDQAGGIVWRFKDEDNYYITRANALEDNVTIYHTINGRRTEKKRAGMKVATGQWHRLRVDFEARHFTVMLDGKKALEWEDETFRDAGKIGVWTKADSVTLFDDFSYGGK